MKKNTLIIISIPLILIVIAVFWFLNSRDYPITTSKQPEIVTPLETPQKSESKGEEEKSLLEQKSSVRFPSTETFARLKVNTVPTGAIINLSGSETEYRSPASLSLTPGSYKIWAIRSDYDVAIEDVILEAGEEQEITIVLKKQESPDPPEGSPPPP